MPSVRSILFMVTALGVLFGTHYFFYYSVVRFFGITNVAHKRLFAGVLIFLSLSFIIASVAAHLQESIFTRAFYFGGGFWLGLLINLLIAATACRLIIWLSGLIGYRPVPSLIGGLLFGMAFMFSVYGVWNAFNPRVKDIHVAIKNLPGQWKGRTIVQLSDVHLGHIYRADFLEKVVAEVNDLHPDMVAITGDLFDGMDGDLSSLAGPLNDLHAPRGVYFVTGNHENYLGVEKAFAVLNKTGVTILNDEVKDIDGLQLVGISYPKRGVAKDLGRTIKSLANFMPGKPTVLLYHPPVDIAEARDAGVNLQLSGHTHKGQIFPICFISREIYKDYYYGLHTLGEYSIYTSAGVGTWGPPMRTGNTPEIVRIMLD